MSNDNRLDNPVLTDSGVGSLARSADSPTPTSDDVINILIVDDEPKNLLVLETILNSSEYRLIRANSGDEALMALVAQDFALLILDIRMPEMSGFELAQIIKERRKTAKIPIIFLTAYYNEDQHVIEGYGSGAVDYLMKPVNPFILRSKVDTFVQLHRMNRENIMANMALQTEVADRRRAQDELREFNATLEQRVIERTNALQDEEERYRMLFHAAPMALFVCDAFGEVRHYNSLAAELWGTQPRDDEKLCSSSLPMRFPDGTQWSKEQSPVDRVLNTGKSIQNLELQIQHSNGSTLPVLANIAPLKDSEGRITGAVVSFINIQERKLAEEKLRESEARKAAVLASAMDGIMTIDHAGQIIEFNPAAEKIFGYSNEAVLQKKIQDIVVPPVEASSDRPGLQVYFDQNDDLIEGTRLELNALDSRGNCFPVEASFIQIKLDGTPLYSSYVRDITERTRMLKQMQEQTKELHALHARKDEFLAMLSHELRNPLAAIYNTVQLLGLNEEDELARVREARVIIERQLSQLHRLVDDLLEVSRITTGRVQLRPTWVSVQKIVESAVQSVRLQVDQHGHALTLTLPYESIQIHADPARLEQILVNLLTNSVKYTPDGGQISLSVENGGDHCLIRIKDNGIGIDQTLLPFIFELFTQADRSLDRSQGGLGIGLALVQRLTEMHGGTIRVESVLGQGSEFIVQLPLQSSEPPPAEAPQSTETPKTNAPARKTKPASLRILVVDDNVDSALSLSMLLRSLGHTVQAVHDGTAALPAAMEFKPEVLILDIGLPGLNGYEIAKLVRRQEELQGVTLIAFTGYGRDTDREEAKEAGFDYHLVKPAGLKQLKPILESISTKKSEPTE